MSLDLAALAVSQRAITSSFFAGAALLGYDYFLTVGREAKYMWGRLTLTSCLYFLARYTPFLDVPIYLFSAIQPEADPTICFILMSVAYPSFLVGSITADVIIALRTWAVWNNTRRAAVVLTLTFIGLYGPIPYFVAKFFIALGFVESPSPVIRGCIAGSEDGAAQTYTFILMMAYEIFVFVVMLIRGAQHIIYNRGTPLVWVLYRDGVIFSFIMMCLSMANAIIFSKLSGQYVVILLVIERVIHSILPVRVVLNLRETAEGEEQLITTVYDTEETRRVLNRSWAVM